MMIGTRQRDLVSNKLLRESLLNVLTTKDDLENALNQFNSYYSTLIGMPKSEIVVIEGDYDLDDSHIYVNHEYMSSNDNFRTLLTYFYQLRNQIQLYALKNDEELIVDSIYDHTLVLAQFKKTPLTNRTYKNYCDVYVSGWASPWVQDAHYYAGFVLTKLIEEYIDYHRRHHIPVGDVKPELLEMRRKSMNYFNTMTNCWKIDEDYYEAITKFYKQYNIEHDLINKAKESLNNGKASVEEIIILKQAWECLNDKEVSLLEASINNDKINNYLSKNKLMNSSLEEVCEYILSNKLNRTR